MVCESMDCFGRNAVGVDDGGGGSYGNHGGADRRGTAKQG